jgi:DNA-binding transcriptional ArsR family regulator
MLLSTAPQLLPLVAERFAAMADENRLRLLMRLRGSPANVSTLAAELGIAQASVSKHLGVLKRVGLVEAERVGTQAVYSVRDASVFDMCRIVCDGVERQIRREHALLATPRRSSGKKGARQS